MKIANDARSASLGGCPSTRVRSCPVSARRARPFIGRPNPGCTAPPSGDPATITISVRGACSRSRVATSATSGRSASELEVYPGVFEGYWLWNGYRIRYQRSGTKGEALVLVHGFGGNADHWRKNTPALGANGHRVFAIDLLGYGYSDKPDPRSAPPYSIYCFPNWGRQVCSFIEEVVGSPAFIIANSVGGLVGLEASIAQPGLVRGVQLIDVCLRTMHLKRQALLMRPFIASLQKALKETHLGPAFFESVAKPSAVRNILRKAYNVKEAVTEELVQKILAPGLLPGAVNVFLDFVSNSGGPLPEELLGKTTVPVSILWGEEDPWEDIKLGRLLCSGYPCVREFVNLPGTGHCPQDEAPELVNPLIEKFVASVVIEELVTLPSAVSWQS